MSTRSHMYVHTYRHPTHPNPQGGRQIPLLTTLQPRQDLAVERLLSGSQVVATQTIPA